MNDAKLFEMAVQLVTAKLHNCTIPPALAGQNHLIVDEIRALHQMLRDEWSEIHHTNNIHDLPPSGR